MLTASFLPQYWLESLQLVVSSPRTRVRKYDVLWMTGKVAGVKVGA